MKRRHGRTVKVTFPSRIETWCVFVGSESQNNLGPTKFSNIENWFVCYVSSESESPGSASREGSCLVILTKGGWVYWIQRKTLKLWGVLVFWKNIFLREVQFKSESRNQESQMVEIRIWRKWVWIIEGCGCCESSLIGGRSRDEKIAERNCNLRLIWRKDNIFHQQISTRLDKKAIRTNPEE